MCAVPWVSCSAKQNFIWQISGTKSAHTDPKHADMSSTTFSQFSYGRNAVVVRQARPHSVRRPNISSRRAVGTDGWISRWTDGRLLSAYSVSRVFRIEGKQRQRWDTDGRPAAARGHGDARQTQLKFSMLKEKQGCSPTREWERRNEVVGERESAYRK